MWRFSVKINKQYKLYYTNLITFFSMKYKP